MKLWFIILFSSAALSQTLYHQPEYRKLFADNLFCTGDYLRAIEEYEEYLKTSYNDTAEFKLILSIAGLGKFKEANQRLQLVPHISGYKEYINAERIKNLIRTQEYHQIRLNYSPGDTSEDAPEKKLKNISYLYTDKDSLPSPPFLLIPFNEEEEADIMRFYNMKNALKEKDPVLAGFMSVFIPGLGKVYTEEYGDAVFSALATGVFGYLAYTNFKNDHTFRGVLFSGIAGWFYAGNIYGSAASAVIFNAKVNFSFTSLLDDYLELKNFFIPDYGFCK
jgi:hypothetical protein